MTPFKNSHACRVQHPYPEEVVLVLRIACYVANLPESVAQLQEFVGGTEELLLILTIP